MDRKDNGWQATALQLLQSGELLIKEEILLLVEPTQRFSAIAVKADDRDQRCVEREIHARLGHRRTPESAGAGPASRRGRAERILERTQGLHVVVVGDAVVVAGDCEDRRGIGLERFVELAVVEVLFAVEIDHVADMIEKGWL